MNREKAVIIVKQISEQCTRIWGRSIVLTTPIEPDTVSSIEVRFMIGDDIVLLSDVLAVARANKLAVKKTNGTLVVY